MTSDGGPSAMRTMFLAFFPVYPPASGASSVSCSLAQHTPGERWLVQMADDPGRRMLGDRWELVTLPWVSSRIGKLVNLRRRVRQMVRWCRRTEPETIVLEGASWVLYHWFLLRALRRAGLKAEVVYHAHNVEYLLRQQRHGRVVRGLTHWAENRVVHGADRVLACSPVDRDEFERLYGLRPDILPNGVDIERYAVVSEEDVDGLRARYGLEGEIVLFMGMYSYRPNREALDFLVGEVFENVVRRRPGARLLVLGGAIPHERPWLIVPGLVSHEDLPGILRACQVGVAPIFSGSGTRVKILEYLAGGLPVVATSKGAEGLGLVDEDHLLVREDAPGFEEAVVELLEDREHACAMGERGCAEVRARFSWKRLLESGIGGARSSQGAKAGT